MNPILRNLILSSFSFISFRIFGYMSKRIAIVTHASQMEGAERSLLAIIKYLVKCDWSVFVAVRMEGEFTEALGKLDIPFQKFRYGWWESEDACLDTKWSERNMAAANTMAEAFEDFGAQLVYTNTAVIGAGALSAQLLNLPHVWHIRELASGHIFDQHCSALPQIGRFISETSNRIVFNSIATSNDWIPYLSDLKNHQVIYNHLDEVAEIQKPEHHDGFRIAVVGSILPIKNQALAIEALAKLIRLYPILSIQLKIIGPIRDQAYHRTLLEKAKLLDVSDNIDWVGFSTEPWVAAIGSNVIVIPGNKEGFGRVCAEALMCKIPVLAAKGGGTDEQIIHGETGLLFDSESENGMVEGLKTYIANPELGKTYADKGRAHIVSLSNEFNTLEKLNTVLSEWIDKDSMKADLNDLLHPLKLPSPSVLKIKKVVKKLLGR